MKALYFFILAFAVASCSSTGNKQKQTYGKLSGNSAELTEKTDKQTDTNQAARKALQAIYADVFKWYALAEKDLSVLNKMPDFDEKYMSSEYKRLLAKVKTIDKKYEDQGEIGFFDYDHWVCGQDFQNLSMKVVKTTVDSGKCSADIVITNCGNENSVIVDLVCENGVWKIDDFHTDGTSEKARMRQYVSDNSKAEARAALDWADSTLWFEGNSRLKNVDANLPDVFYLLPTCVAAWNDDAGTTHYNADPKNPEHRKAWQLSAELADTIFATRANLFLPYYRQATFGGLPGEGSEKYGNIALHDVCDAFDYYLDNYNHGRRFILAGYSQGGLLVKELLKHIDDDTYNRMIAAYVVGYGVTAQDTAKQKGHRFSHVRLAQDSSACGVTINFNSVTTASAISSLLCDKNIGCINPVSWTTTSAPAILLGAGKKAGADDTRFPYATAVLAKETNTSVTVSVDTLNHVLMVGGISPQRYFLPALQDYFPEGNLHLQELFFYGDCLRRNVLLRSGQ